MKKIAIAAMAAVVAVSLSACGGKTSKDGSGKKDSSSGAAGTPAGNTPGIVVVDPNEGRPAADHTAAVESSEAEADAKR